MSEIAEYCMTGRVKLTQVHADYVMGILFPIFSNDNLESIVERYLKLYAFEAKLVLADFQESIKENETGFSKEKLMKLRTRIPARIHEACKALSPNFWNVDNGKNIDRFIALCPKLATKNKNIIKG